MLLRIESATADWRTPGVALAKGRLREGGAVKGLKELVAVVCELDRLALFRGAHSRPVVFELMSRLGARATTALDDLWRECIAPRSDVSSDYLSATAARLCFVLFDAFSICVDRLDDVEDTPSAAPPAAFWVSGMRIGSWCARWSWLRYELPPAHLWISSGSFHKLAERWLAGGVGAAESHMTTVERGYLSMLLLDWLRPDSLSLAAFSLLNGALDKCLDGICLEKEGGRKATTLLLNRVSGRLELHGDAAGAQPDGNFCSVPAEEVMARLERHLLQYGEGQAQRNALHAIAMRRIDVRGRCGKGSDPRIAYLSCRFGGAFALVSTGRVRARCNGMQGIKEATFLDVSRYGCRIALPVGEAAEVGIGCLLAMMCPQKSEITLGIVRRIERGGAGSLEIGVDIQPGSVSAYLAAGTVVGYSVEYVMRPVLVLEDIGEGHQESFRTVLVAKDFFADGEDIRLLNSTVVLRKVSLVESGPDFDLYLCRVS